MPPPAPQPEVQGSTGLEEDEEMREVFIDEAREVIQGADEALERLDETPDDLGDLTLIRRAFHTLKGSSRMVGLKDFGEAAWSCEQLYNTRLAESSRLEHDLGAFTADALRELGDWVEAIAESRARGRDGAALSCRGPMRCATAAPQTAGRTAQQVAEASAALRERVPELPSATDLQLWHGPSGRAGRSAGGRAFADPPRPGQRRRDAGLGRRRAVGMLSLDLPAEASGESFSSAWTCRPSLAWKRSDLDPALDWLEPLPASDSPTQPA